MKVTVLFPGIIAVLATALLAACRKDVASQKPLAVYEVPKVLDDAFTQAKPEATAAAREIVASVREGDPNALLRVQELAVLPDLTTDQRVAANRAMAALHKKMLEDAARGDSKAEEALKNYRASK